MAAGYDAGAALVHPHYVAVQDVILDRLSLDDSDDALVVDLGGGSGRLAERILDRSPNARVLVIDQSDAFLELAAARLKRFDERGMLACARLQDDWQEHIPVPAAAVVSMSAIHHLDADEKQTSYRRAFEIMQPGGSFINGDEVRAESETEYRQQVLRWSTHMQRLIDEERVTPAMAEGLRKWQHRNVDNFDARRTSGDDCHETVDAQLGYLKTAGFAETSAIWSQELWTILYASKGTD